MAATGARPRADESGESWAYGERGAAGAGRAGRVRGVVERRSRDYFEKLLAIPATLLKGSVGPARSRRRSGAPRRAAGRSGRRATLLGRRRLVARERHRWRPAGFPSGSRPRSVERVRLRLGL